MSLSLCRLWGPHLGLPRFWPALQLLWLRPALLLRLLGLAPQLLCMCGGGSRLCAIVRHRLLLSESLGCR